MSRRWIDTAAMIAAITIVLLLWYGVASAGTQTASGITAQTLVDRLRQDVNDSTTTFFTDAEASRWCDEAVKTIVTYARCLETTLTLTCTTGAMLYTVTTAHFDIETVFYDSADTSTPFRYFFLDKIDPRDAYKLPKESGRPQVWFEWAGKIGIWPVPGTNENGKSIVLYLVSKPTGVSSVSSSIETPFYFDSVILLYLKAKYAEKDHDEGKATYYRTLFYQSIDKYNKEVRLRQPMGVPVK